MTDEQAKWLRALAERATPGPWNADAHKNVMAAGGLVAFPGIAAGFDQSANAAYIAAASPDAILALLDERDAMRRELDEQKRVIDDAYAALGGDAWWMDPPDGGSPTLAEMVAKANEDGRALYDVKRARDAAMALLAKADRLFNEASDARQTFPMVSIAHWMDEYRALLGDGGEA